MNRVHSVHFLFLTFLYFFSPNTFTMHTVSTGNDFLATIFPTVFVEPFNVFESTNVILRL